MRALERIEMPGQANANPNINKYTQLIQVLENTCLSRISYQLIEAIANKKVLLLV